MSDEPTATADTPAAIRTAHEAAQKCAAEAVRHAICAGELLIEVKGSLAHGEFAAWLAANVPFSARTARGYMRLASLDEEKRQGVADLSLRGALRVLASPRFADPGGDVESRNKLEYLRVAHEHLQAILAEPIPSSEWLPRAQAIMRECKDMLLDIGARGPRSATIFIYDVSRTLAEIQKRDNYALPRTTADA